jgi:metal-responsive CopG/Arc/MetJ family transcriptional regulator
MPSARKITRKPPRPAKRAVVQVSLGELLDQIDKDPETKLEGRSAFIRKAVKLYLDAKRRHELDEGIYKAFAGKADEMEREISEIMESQAWPRDE